jgi:hypothetical protein
MLPFLPQFPSLLESTIITVASSYITNIAITGTM